MANHKSSGGRISGQFFPTALGLVGTGTLLLWLMAAWGAVKPTAVIFGDVHNHFHDSPAPAPVSRPAPAPFVIQTAPANVIIRGDLDPQRAGRVVTQELEARQQMVEAARRELAGELNSGARVTPQQLIDSYHQGVERIYGNRSAGLAPVGPRPAAGAPTDGWWISDCEGEEEATPLSVKFRGLL